MYSITDLKKGVLIEVNGQVYRVLSYEHSSKARGGGVVKTKLKSITDGSTLSKTFQGNEQIAPADVASVKAQMLYTDTEQIHFMRLDSFEQVSLPVSEVSNVAGFLMDGMDLELLYINGAPKGVDLPIKVTQKVATADPNVKGDSAGSVMKNCQTETGLNVGVPLFIEAGDSIVVDTRDGSYVERG